MFIFLASYMFIYAHILKILLFCTSSSIVGPNEHLRDFLLFMETTSSLAFLFRRTEIGETPPLECAVSLDYFMSKILFRPCHLLRVLQKLWRNGPESSFSAICCIFSIFVATAKFASTKTLTEEPKNEKKLPSIKEATIYLCQR